MRLWYLSTLVLSVALPLAAQEVQFLDCPEVAFFESHCAEGPAEEVPEPVLLAPPIVAPLPAPVLLFPRETVAPTTPPLMLQLLNEPTEANARLFRAWEQERKARGKLVEDLLKWVISTEGKE